MKIPGISGSLRKASYNTGLLRAASAFIPGGIEILKHGDIPLYNGDLTDDMSRDFVRQLAEAPQKKIEG